MCGSPDPPEIDDTPQKLQMDAAAEARAREQARQQRIATGRSFLGAMFEGGTGTIPTNPAQAVNLAPDAAPGNAKWEVRRGDSSFLPSGGGSGGLTQEQQQQLAALKPAPRPNRPQGPRAGAEGFSTLKERHAYEKAMQEYNSWDGNSAEYNALKQQFLEENEAKSQQRLQNPQGATRQFEGVEPFLADRRQSLTNFYMPQINDQAQDAQDNLTFAHARSGTLQSSMAADNVGELQNDIDMQRMSTLSNIDGQVNQMRGRFADTRMQLENMLASTGDSQMAINSGLAQVQNLYNQQPQLNPLGDVFANAASGIGQYGQGYQRGRIAGIYNQPNITSTVGSGGSSGKIVRG